MRNLKKLLLPLLLLFGASPLFAESDAFVSGTSTTTGVQQNMQVINVGAVNHVLTYVAVGTTASIVIQIEGSTNNGVSYTLCGSTLNTLPAGQISCSGIYDHIRANITTLTGAAPQVLWSLYSYTLSGGNTPVGATGVAPTNIYPGLFVSYSPSQLGVNGLTLPASATSAQSNIIDMRGVKAYTLVSNCGQIYNLLASNYAEDGTTSQNTGTVQSAVPASAGIANNIGTPNPTAGSTFVLPQRAVSFSFTNTTATPSTCTARLFVQY